MSDNEKYSTLGEFERMSREEKIDAVGAELVEKQESHHKSLAGAIKSFVSPRIPLELEANIARVRHPAVSTNEKLDALLDFHQIQAESQNKQSFKVFVAIIIGIGINIILGTLNVLGIIINM